MSEQSTEANTSQKPADTTQGEGPFARLTRTVTDAKSYFTQRAASSQANTAGQDSAPLASTESGTPKAADASRKPPPTAFERFMSLGRNRKDGDIEFPPPHWVENNPGLESTAPDGPNAGSEHATRAEEPQVVPDEAQTTDTSATPPPPPEPLTLAKRIQAALANLPPITGSSSNGASEGSAKASPAPPQLVSDAGMISFLSSPSVMNGDGSKSGQSVWSALDRLRAVIPGQGAKQPADAPLEPMGQGEGQVLEDDESGVMVYGPLFPDENSQVELAESELVPGTPREGEEPQAGGAQDTWKGRLEGILGRGKEREQAGQASGEDSTPSSSRVHVHSGKSKRVWVPSPDKISVQVMWWGYRIFLPPPVLDILDNKSIEGAKRAALLTTALKYALDRVPMVMIPPQARPAMRMLKAFTPYLGYVGGFVAWSWGAVKSFDKGNGVTLTATWLLTVAVIPGSWEDKDFPHPVAHEGRAEKTRSASGTSTPRPPPSR